MATLNHVVKYDKEAKKNVAVTDEEKVTPECNLLYEPIPFKCVGKTSRITSGELARMIREHFQEIFYDLRGVNIVMPQMNQFAVEFYFEHNSDPVPDGKISNLKSLIDPNSNPKAPEIYAKIHAMDNYHTGKYWELTDATKALLHPYVIGGLNNKNFWKNANNVCNVNMPTTNDMYYQYKNTDHNMVVVRNLDLHTILKSIYGNSIVCETVTKVDDDGSTKDVNYKGKAYYEVECRGYAQNGSGQMLLNIQQFDADEVQAIFAKENPPVQQFGSVVFY